MSLKKSEALMIKLQPDIGVDALPDPLVDGLLVDGLSWSNEGLVMHEQQLSTGFGKLRPLYGGHLKAITFNAPLRPSGVVAAPPAEDAALQACGLELTVNAGASCIYTDVQTDLKMVTIYYYEGAVLHKLVDAVGKVSFKVDAQAPAGVAEYTFIGHDSVIADPLPAIDYDDSAPAMVRGAGFMIDGYAASVGSLAIDLGNEVAYTKDMNAPAGYSSPQIVDRDMTGSIDPMLSPLATYDWMAKMQAGELVGLTTGDIGTVPGRIVKFDLTGVGYSDVSQSDREKQHARGVNFMIEDRKSVV